MDQNPNQNKVCLSEGSFGSGALTNPVDLSIVIVSYNTRDVIRQCLESITMSEIMIPYEIIVVDNGSRDGTNELIESYYDSVILIRNQKNLLFAKASNQGIRAARGAYIMLMNSDTLFEKGAAEILIRFLMEHPKAAAAGPKILNLNGTLQSKGAPLLSVFSTVMTLLGVGKHKMTRKLAQTLFRNVCWEENQTLRVGWIAGCCMMMRKVAIVEIGGLCEELFFYGEELEWCHRAKKAGWEIWYVPESSVFHIGGCSTSKEMRRALEDKDLQLRNYRVLMKNTVGLGRGAAISFVTIILKFLRYLVALAIRKEEKFCSDLLRQAKWEIVVFKFLLTNGGKESRA